jgi:hypothetical protein
VDGRDKPGHDEQQLLCPAHHPTLAAFISSRAARTALMMF